MTTHNSNPSHKKGNERSKFGSNKAAESDKWRRDSKAQVVWTFVASVNDVITLSEHPTMACTIWCDIYTMTSYVHRDVIYTLWRHIHTKLPIRKRKLMTRYNKIILPHRWRHTRWWRHYGSERWIHAINQQRLAGEEWVNTMEIQKTSSDTAGLLRINN